VSLSFFACLFCPPPLLCVCVCVYVCVSACAHTPATRAHTSGTCGICVSPLQPTPCRMKKKTNEKNESSQAAAAPTREGSRTRCGSGTRCDDDDKKATRQGTRTREQDKALARHRH
jgi:hypothetical protein